MSNDIKMPLFSVKLLLAQVVIETTNKFDNDMLSMTMTTQYLFRRYSPCRNVSEGEDSNFGAGIIEPLFWIHSCDRSRSVEPLPI